MVFQMCVLAGSIEGLKRARLDSRDRWLGVFCFPLRRQLLLCRVCKAGNRIVEAFWTRRTIQSQLREACCRHHTIAAYELHTERFFRQAAFEIDMQ